MKVLLFGATGMVGQAALKACLDDARVTQVTAVGRRPTGITDPKLREVQVPDLADVAPVLDQLRGHDACLWCLGVSSLGMKEPDYRRVTYDYTLAAAKLLAKVDPRMVFVYVSGAGTDSTEKGRSMWARVKGKTENDLLALFPRAVMFRPGYIQPRDGVRSKTKWVQALYTVVGFTYPILPKSAATDTRVLGRAFVEAAAGNAPRRVMESRDINELGGRP